MEWVYNGNRCIREDLGFVEAGITSCEGSLVTLGYEPYGVEVGYLPAVGLEAVVYRASAKLLGKGSVKSPYIIVIKTPTHTDLLGVTSILDLMAVLNDVGQVLEKMAITARIREESD